VSVFGEQLPQKISGRDDDEVACGHKEAVPEIIFVVFRFHRRNFLPMATPDAPKPLMKASVHLLNICISNLTSICQESFSLVSLVITQAHGEQPCAGGFSVIERPRCASAQRPTDLFGAQPGGDSLKRLLTIPQRPCSGWSADVGRISTLLQRRQDADVPLRAALGQECEDCLRAQAVSGPR
jgi:hypothetical protein